MSNDDTLDAPRDRTTEVERALRAAETGHLVLTSLATSNLSVTLERLAEITAHDHRVDSTEPETTPPTDPGQ
jgi:Tfp pilus assembly pilus retraction ATPase PilT